MDTNRHSPFDRLLSAALKPGGRWFSRTGTEVVMGEGIAHTLKLTVGDTFKPRPELFTAHQMILHIAEAERGWIHHVVDGGPDEEWIAPHHDPARGWVTVVDAPDRAALLDRLETWHRATQRWFDRPEAELGRVLSRTRDDGSIQRFTLHWILDHVQEHEIHHRAQLNVYLRLLGIEPPSI